MLFASADQAVPPYAAADNDCELTNDELAVHVPQLLPTAPPKTLSQLDFILQSHHKAGILVDPCRDPCGSLLWWQLPGQHAPQLP
jgi:hypothetical protein